MGLLKPETAASARGSERHSRSGPIRTAHRAVLVLCLFGGLFVGQGLFGPAFATEALEIDSDRMEMDDKRQTAVFSGKVRAKDGEMRLAADRMTVYYFKKGRKHKRSGIREVRAEGRVKLEERQNRGTAEKMVYKIQRQTLELLGRKKNAVIQYGDDRLSGRRIVLTIGRNRNIEKVSVVGGNSKRVSARITPDGEVLNGPRARSSKRTIPAPPSGAPKKKSRGEKPPPREANP